jgi:hypothetical protein
MQLHEEDFAALDDLGKEEHAIMQENDFVKRLLPHLIPPEEPSKRPKDMTIWVEAAGHAQRLIDVVDRNGVVLFTVPPILSRSPTAVPEKDTNPDNDLGEIGAIYDMRIGNEPSHVVNEWYFASLVSRSYSPEQSLMYLYARMWINIYRRYNIPLERLFGEKGAVLDAQIPNEAKKAEAAPSGNINHDIADDDFEAM